jgi:hypothetical protein
MAAPALLQSQQQAMLDSGRRAAAAAAAGGPCCARCSWCGLPQQLLQPLQLILRCYLCLNQRDNPMPGIDPQQLPRYCLCRLHAAQVLLTA